MMLCNFSCERVITFQTVVDPGEGPRGPEPSPLFLDQTEAQRGKIFFGRPAPPLSKGLNDRPTTPHPHTPISRSGSATAKNMYSIFFTWSFLEIKKLSHQVTRILNAFHVSPRSEQTHTWDTLLA